ncbi:MAG: sensor histidine kinase [Rubrobacteraceae bacterium]
MQAAKGQLEDTYGQVREVVSDLKRRDETRRFDEALRGAVGEVAGRLGLRVDCEAEACPALPAPAQRNLLAIVQEALTNAHRHGRARRAAVRLETSGKDLEIEVSDEGGGFDPDSVPREGRYGLAIMEERARMVGGRLLLDAAPERGTRVTVRVPGAVP